MTLPSVAELVPVVQAAIGPVILISGVGLLLLAMTNRLGQLIARARQLGDELRSTAGTGAAVQAQLRVLWSRARLLRAAIALASLSALAAALLVILIFLSALLRFDAAVLIVALFAACMCSLIGALVVFVRDVNLSLEALRIELRDNGLTDL